MADVPFSSFVENVKLKEFQELLWNNLRAFYKVDKEYEHLLTCVMLKRDLEYILRQCLVQWKITEDMTKHSDKTLVKEL